MDNGYKIKTILKDSTIPGAGKGLFFDDNYDENTLVRIQEIGSNNLIKINNVRELESYDKDVISAFCHSVPKYTPLHDDCIFLNNPRGYFNHSKNNNIEAVYTIFTKYIITTKDVKKGDEVFLDYTNYKKIKWFEDYLKENKLTCARTFGLQLEKDTLLEDKLPEI